LVCEVRGKRGSKGGKGFEGGIGRAMGDIQLDFQEHPVAVVQSNTVGIDRFPFQKMHICAFLSLGSRNSCLIHIQVTCTLAAPMSTHLLPGNRELCKVVLYIRTAHLMFLDKLHTQKCLDHVSNISMLSSYSTRSRLMKTLL
jgi:hypothetical protein